MRRSGAACAVVSISVTLAGDGERDFALAARGEGWGDFDVVLALAGGGTRNLDGRSVGGPLCRIRQPRRLCVLCFGSDDSCCCRVCGLLGCRREVEGGFTLWGYR